MRIGHGFDVHAFAAERALVLGGVTIPHERGLAGHSDADALVHAVCDACLGAIGAGDVGRHFPDSDPHYAGIDSRLLLRRVTALLGDGGWRVANVDATVIAQRPRLSPYTEQMCENLAADLGVARDQVNVKATTTESLGYLGREEGIAVHAVVLIEKAADERA
jgi:2-C-methyl-D-erythritol 2,4-cyclodiphosphate synthase